MELLDRRAIARSAVRVAGVAGHVDWHALFSARLDGRAVSRAPRSGLLLLLLARFHAFGAIAWPPRSTASDRSPIGATRSRRESPAAWRCG